MSLNGNPLPQEYYDLLEELQAADFVLVELTLYLDTHQNDQQAINQFNQFAKHRQEVKQSIESKYGPLQQYGNSFADAKWSWNNSPWPWQV